MAVYEIEQAVIYRAGRRRFFSRTAAIRRYARDKVLAKYPCECEPVRDDGGYDCGCHARLDKVLPRYMRVIRRALKRKPLAAQREPEEPK